MRLLNCQRCNDACQARRMQRVNKQGITELYDLIYHKDGTKERKIWATLKGQEVISAKFI